MFQDFKVFFILFLMNDTFHCRLQSFLKKHDLFSMILVFDQRGMPDSGPGYRHPERECDVTEDFTMVMSVPQVCSFNLIY